MFERKHMLDVEIAKRQLFEKGFSLVIVKDEKIILETRQSGVNGFLSAIEELGRERLHAASVADRIVGRAAALLCVYCGVKAVYAVVLSEEGKSVLKENSVSLEFKNLVPSILNRQKTGTCPFEKIVSTVSDGQEAYEKLKSCISEKVVKR
jgi:uncharacterized linocin/CFP29 family protein